MPVWLDVGWIGRSKELTEIKYKSYLVLMYKIN